MRKMRKMKGSSHQMASNQVANLIEQISSGVLKFYVVSSSGPTNYLIKEEGNERKFKDLPIVWQTSLRDNEVEDILHGRINHTKGRSLQKHAFLKRSTKAGMELKFDARRPVAAGEVCPICQEEFEEAEQQKNLAHCKVGCGNCVHVHCMKIWAEHKISVKEKVTCPLCRVDWGPYALLELRTQQRAKASRRLKRNDHPRIFRCQKCKACPIVGKLYLCLECPSPFVAACEKCFERGFHKRSGHSFAMKANGFDDWHPVLSRAEKLRTEAAPPSLVNELQGREITADDYHLLLSLDERDKNVEVNFPKYLAGLFPRQGLSMLPLQGNLCGGCQLDASTAVNSCVTTCCMTVYHRSCLEEILSGLRQYLCPREDCKRPLLPGFGYYLEIKQTKKSVVKDPPHTSSDAPLTIEVVGTGQARGVGGTALPRIATVAKSSCCAISMKQSKKSLKCRLQNPSRYGIHRNSRSRQTIKAALLKSPREVPHEDLGFCIRPQSINTRHFG